MEHSPLYPHKGMEVPRTTVEILSCFYWIDSKTNMELSVYDDGSWELCDDDYNTLNEGSEDSVKINGYDIVLTSDYGGELEMELSEDGSQITGYEDMTFRCITTVGDDGDEAEEESYPEEDTEPEAITKENFYGCWKNENRQFWIIFYEDFTYEMYWGEEETGMKGEYELYGDEIRLNAGPRYTPDGEGNLVDVSGDTYYPAEPPAFIYDITFDDEDSSFGDIPSYDDERFEADESDEAYDFCGCWEYQDDDLWLCIYNDGTCEWYDAEGLYGVDTYYIEDGVLYLEQEGVTLEAMFGGLVGSDDSTLFSSLLPDYDGNDMDGAEDFIGCWEDTSEDIWLEIYSDGTYLIMWDDGYGSSGRCYMDGDELCLQSGTRFYMDYENSVIVSDEYTMFRSEMPDHLR